MACRRAAAQPDDAPWSAHQQADDLVRAVGQDDRTVLHRDRCAGVLQQVALHHLAKRQLTWFRRDDEIRWYHPEKQRQEIIETVRLFLH